MPGKTATNDGLEAQARADLAAGRWRKARDAFKELCKRDRATFRPLLIEANVGLARAMVAKGLISDARQVAAYLKTLAPPAIVAALEQEIAAASTRSAAETRPPSPDPLSLLAGGAGAPAERARWADDLVVAFARATSKHKTRSDASEQIAADLAIIHEAIDALCGGDSARALDLVRPLRRESPFVHWRLFVRAVAAFQLGDAEKAIRYFAELPADSVPGRARAAWLLVLGGGADLAAEAAVPPDPMLEAATAITGHAGIGRALARAETQWRAGKHPHSYRTMREARTPFPADGADLMGALSDFYFNAVFTMSDRDHLRYEDYLCSLDLEGLAKRPAERQRIRRARSLILSAELYDKEDVADLRAAWGSYIREHERLQGANPRLASVGWAWFGEILSRPTPSPFQLHPKPLDAEGAIGAFTKSIELDPANASAHVLLATLYKTLGRNRDLNRLLDVIAARFPDDKDALVAAGAGCLHRKAFAKAAGYFERALALDRLDPAMPDNVAAARLLLARQHFVKHSHRKAREELDRVDAMAVDSADNLVRGRWALAARRGVMETMYGDGGLGAAALDTARAAAPSLPRFSLFVRLTWSFYDKRKPLPALLKSESDRAAEHAASAREAAELVSIMRYWAEADSSRGPRTNATWLERYLEKAIHAPFTRDEAARLVGLLRDWPAFRDSALAFTRRMLERDKADPLFRLYDVALHPFPHLSPSQGEEILGEARRRGDAAAEQLARELMIGMGPPLWGQAPGAFGDDIDDVDDDLGSGPDLDPPTGPQTGELAALVEILSIMPEAEIARIRRQRPKEIPVGLLDSLLAIARGRAAPSRPDRVPRPDDVPRPDPAPRRRAARKPTQDPNQPELF